MNYATRGAFILRRAIDHLKGALRLMVCSRTTDLFSDLNVTHDPEEKLRAESMALIYADPRLSKRLGVIEKAMALILEYTYCSRQEFGAELVREFKDNQHQ